MAKETTFPNGFTLVECKTEEEINEWYRRNGSLRGYALIPENIPKEGDPPAAPSSEGVTEDPVSDSGSSA